MHRKGVNLRFKAPIFNCGWFDTSGTIVKTRGILPIVFKGTVFALRCDIMGFNEGDPSGCRKED